LGGPKVIIHIIFSTKDCEAGVGASVLTGRGGFQVALFVLLFGGLEAAAPS
jgi:hypothetical protein